MRNSNKMVLHIEVNGAEIQEIIDFLAENDIMIDAISTKELYDQLNYQGRGYRC